MKPYSLVIILLVLCARNLYAIDLTEMQETALNNRQVVRQYMAILERSEKDIVRARGGYYPSVDLGYTANFLREATVLENKQNSITIGRVSWNLFDGFRDKYTLLSAEKQKEVEQFRLEGVQQDIQLNVALAYLAVFERRANRRVAESAYQTLDKIYRDGETRYKVGLIGKNDLLRFRVDYDNADISLKKADADLQKGVNALSRQVGREIRLSDLDFAEFNNLPPQIDRDEYTRKMLEKRSEINALKAVIAATEASASAAAGAYYPRVDLVGTYKHLDNDVNSIDINNTSFINDNELRAQLVVSMNLFQGFTTEATVARAKLETRSAQYQLEELKNDLTTELDNLDIDLQVSLDNVAVAKRSIEQAEENLRITHLKYNQGLQRESDLLDAITKRSRARFNYVSVLRTAFSNNFQLIRMVDGF